ncbi:MAG: MazG family protein [Actinobacteria bacterium]|nr:MazG family protein [Actinomycetota bacterium]
MVDQPSQLEELRRVMDRLRSPGGCPWDAEQNHESLLKYLLEESYEFIEAVEQGDRVAMREELGDVLLQVYFHARMAEEHPTDPFSVEDVAQVVAQKLVRRHPHVFGDVKVSGSAQVLENWEAQKAAEKGRTSAVEGVPLAQPAMALAAKLMYRAEKFGYDLPITHPVKISVTTQGELGELLMGIIDQAISLGLDPEAALRGATKGYIARITEYEAKTNGS